MHIKDENLKTALIDVAEAIRGLTLGSIESMVIFDAGKSLIENWNDHNEDKIDVTDELNNWSLEQSNNFDDVHHIVHSNWTGCHICGGPDH
jgi:hypothetical protein